MFVWFGLFLYLFICLFVCLLLYVVCRPKVVKQNVLGTVVGQSATDPAGRVTVAFAKREDGRSNNLPLGDGRRHGQNCFRKKKTFSISDPNKSGMFLVGNLRAKDVTLASAGTRFSGCLDQPQLRKSPVSCAF